MVLYDAQKAPGKTSERDMASVTDDFVPDMLLQNHGLFIDAVKSWLTKLQVTSSY